MRTLIATLLCLTLLACSQATRETPDREDRKGKDPAPLPRSDELAGLPVETAKEGPWTVRRVKRAGRSADGREVVEESLALGADMDVAGAPVADPGDAAPPAGVAAPAEAARPSAPAPSPESPSKMEISGGGRAEPTRPTPALRAGATDDNAEYDAFLEYLADWSDRPDLAGRFRMLDVGDRRYVRVVDARGRPVPAAEVRVVSEAADAILLAGTTYGDGRVPFYPLLRLVSGAKGPPAVVFSPEAAGGLVVEVAVGDARKRVRWDGKGKELTVEVDGAPPVEDPVKLDVTILLDTTGSMGDEIERIKATLLRVTERLRSLEREFDLRYGAVLYRDLGDAYVTKAHPFTGDIRAFDGALKAVRAQGGGDTPESLNQGLAEAVGRMDWRDGAAKVLFLIADAPPHMDYEGDVPYDRSLVAAVARGIRIHAVAASGLDPLGSLIFRQIAQYTRGKFVFIEYGTVERSAAKHGVKGKVKANNLDDILFEQIREEVARWGR